MDILLTHGLYGARPRGHLTAYRMAPGWYFAEAGGWTLEIDTAGAPRRVSIAVALAAFVLGTALPSPVQTARDGWLQRLGSATPAPTPPPKAPSQGA